MHSYHPTITMIIGTAIMIATAMPIKKLEDNKDKNDKKRNKNYYNNNQKDYTS